MGSIIAKLAGQYLKPVLLELGGKAPLIVLEDANLELAAKTAVAGAWAHVSSPSDLICYFDFPDASTFSRLFLIMLSLLDIEILLYLGDG